MDGRCFEFIHRLSESVSDQTKKRRLNNLFGILIEVNPDTKKASVYQLEIDNSPRQHDDDMWRSKNVPILMFKEAEKKVLLISLELYEMIEIGVAHLSYLTVLR